MLVNIFQVKSRPGSSQVSSIAPSDTEEDDSMEQQHIRRKRGPVHDDRDRKRHKDSVSAGQHSFDIDEIEREVKRCIEVNISLLKTKEIEPEEVFKLLHRRICQCIAQTLDKQLGDIKERIAVDCKQKLGPFKDVSKTQLDEIDRSSSAFRIMEHLGILDRWLNTARLHYFISLSRHDSPQSSKADYWLQQYREVVNDFCSEVLVKNLPDEYHKQLCTRNTRQEHHRMLCVVYQHEFAKFTLADLLKELDFLAVALEIPPDVMKYLQTIPSNSIAVYWLFDMSYAAQIFFDVHQLFWPLLEHRVLSLELKDVMTISLHGSHVSYLIKNALQTGQNLIQQTEVCDMEHILLYVHAVTTYGIMELNLCLHALYLCRYSPGNFTL